MKNNKKVLGLTLLIVVLIPYAIYFFNFRGEILSKDTSIWGDFGAYINGTIMPIIAIVGFIISYTISKYSEEQNQNNIKRQEMLQRPLLYISCFDSNDRVSIKLTNKGIGPALLQDYKIIDIDMEENYDSIYKVLKDLGSQTYSTYTGNLKNLILSPNETVNLFILDKEKYKSKTKFEDLCIDVKDCFRYLRFEINYKDVYLNDMPLYERSLEWFGRQ